MRTSLCDQFGIDFPIFAFTPSEHVAAAVSRAGGSACSGASGSTTPRSSSGSSTSLDEHTDGKPYGVDIVMPMKIPTEGTSVDLGAMFPEEHEVRRQDAAQLGVPPLLGRGPGAVLVGCDRWRGSNLDVALQHRPVLIANALGRRRSTCRAVRRAGVKVAALAGAAKHALSHVADGVDMIVAQGYEAGGHTGEIASMVLTPDIVDASGPTHPSSAPAASAPAVRLPRHSRSAPRACGPVRSG